MKDIFNFEDQQVPRSISDANQLNGAIIATTTAIVVDSGSEFTDPTNLPSKDLFPVVLRLDPDGTSEDVIIGSISANTLTVQANFLDKSEEFDDAAWVKTTSTVTADQAAPPLGGDAAADTIDLPTAGTSKVEQDSGEAPGSVDWVFSVWLRNGPNAAVDSATVTVEVTDGTTTGTNSVTVTRAAWTRVETTATLGAAGTVSARVIRAGGDTSTEVQAFGAQLEKATTRGFYVGTDGNAGDDAGRGAFGTTAATGADDLKISEVMPYRLHRTNSGVHPVVILRDLVNRGNIALADVDQATFDREFTFDEGFQLRRSGNTLIDKPRKLSQHVKEVRQQALLDLWMSETGLVRTRFSFRQNLPGVDTISISDEANVLFRSSGYKGNKESRKTELYIYFNPKTGEKDPRQPDDFDNVEVVADLITGVASGPKAQVILSKWIFRSVEAISTAGRYVSRFKRGARIATWDLDIKDTALFDLGDILELDSDDIPVISGNAAVRGKTRWQAVQKRHMRTQGKLRIESLEFSGLQFGVISPDEDLETAPDAFPDFPAASTDERQYGFIGDTQNRVAGALTTAPFTLVSATYTASTKRIFETGIFASYTFNEGDAFFPIHASAHSAFYLIDSKVDDDTIELRVAIKNVTDGATDSGNLVGLTNDTTKFRTQLQDGYFIT